MKTYPLVEQARSGPGTSLMRFVFGQGRREPPKTPVWLTCKWRIEGKPVCLRLLAAPRQLYQSEPKQRFEAHSRISDNSRTLPVHGHGNWRVSDRYHVDS